MSKINTILLLSLITISSIKLCTCDNAYDGNDLAFNTSAGAQFEKEVGLDYALFVLQNSSSFFWETFNQNKISERKNISLIALNIQSMHGIVENVNDPSNSQIFLNVNYVANYVGDVKSEVTGILYHEIARIRQWYGNGDAPLGLITGIADFFRLKGGYASKNWVQLREGSRWDEGYDVTARFLDYYNNFYDGFVANINNAMSDGYDEIIFRMLTGMSVDELWAAYKSNED